MDFFIRQAKVKTEADDNISTEAEEMRNETTRVGTKVVKGNRLFEDDFMPLPLVPEERAVNTVVWRNWLISGGEVE